MYHSLHSRNRSSACKTRYQLKLDFCTTKLHTRLRLNSRDCLWRLKLAQARKIDLLSTISSPKLCLSIHYKDRVLIYIHTILLHPINIIIQHNIQQNSKTKTKTKKVIIYPKQVSIQAISHHMAVQSQVELPLVIIFRSAGRHPVPIIILHFSGWLGNIKLLTNWLSANISAQ